jgi:hypothetical protein
LIELPSKNKYKMSTLEFTTFEERLQQAQKFKERFPNNVPLVIQRDERSTLPPDLHNKLFLAPLTLTASQFIVLIRRQTKLPKTHAMVLFAESKRLVTSDITISELYDKFSAQDGFLYLLCTDHPAFG